MKIKIDNVVFVPMKWDFLMDGTWGHIYFLVDRGIFEYGNNDGAYCYEDKNSKCDIVHMATPCMEDGGNLEKLVLSNIFKAAASEIVSNLTRKPK